MSEYKCGLTLRQVCVNAEIILSPDLIRHNQISSGPYGGPFSLKYRVQTVATEVMLSVTVHCHAAEMDVI